MIIFDPFSGMEEIVIEILRKLSPNSPGDSLLIFGLLFLLVLRPLGKAAWSFSRSFRRLVGIERRRARGQEALVKQIGVLCNVIEARKGRRAPRNVEFN